MRCKHDVAVDLTMISKSQEMRMRLKEALKIILGGSRIHQLLKFGHLIHRKAAEVVAKVRQQRTIRTGCLSRGMNVIAENARRPKHDNITTPRHEVLVIFTSVGRTFKRSKNLPYRRRSTQRLSRIIAYGVHQEIEGTGSLHEFVTELVGITDYSSVIILHAK